VIFRGPCAHSYAGKKLRGDGSALGGYLRAKFKNNLLASNGSPVKDDSILVRRAADGERFFWIQRAGAEDLWQFYC